MPDEPAPEPDAAGSNTAPEPDAAAAASAALRRATRGTSARARTGRRRASTGSRDPQPLGEAVEGLLAEQGWQDRSAVAVLMASWPDVVGADLAAHVVPAAFAGGELVLEAESTAWATQVRLLLPSVHRAIDERIGGGLVTAIRVRGPQAPSWSAGPRRVKGRGPRDTYG